jgi:hypothetical protein
MGCWWRRRFGAVPRGCGGPDDLSGAGNRVGETAGPNGPDPRETEQSSQKGYDGQDCPLSG